MSDVIAYLTQFACVNLTGSVSRATSNGIVQSWLISPMKNLWLVRSESQVQKSSWMINRTLDGIVSRLVWKVSNPRDFRVRVK